MRTLKLGVGALVILASISTVKGVVSVSGRGPRPIGSSLSARAIRPKYSLVVTLPCREFVQGERIRVTCEFRNLSNAETTIWSTLFWLNHLVVVEDERGVEPELSEVGRRNRQLFSPGGNRLKNFAIKVAPGRSWTIAGAGNTLVDLNELYALAPGRYSVKVIYEEKIRPAMKVTSDPVRFVVK